MSDDIRMVPMTRDQRDVIEEETRFCSSPIGVVGYELTAAFDEQPSSDQRLNLRGSLVADARKEDPEYARGVLDRIGLDDRSAEGYRRVVILALCCWLDAKASS